jgi:hypothetical protein
MPPKRKRASSSKDNADDDVKVNSNKRFELRMEELLNSISREVSDLKNENKNMKESINEMKNEIKVQNDEMKHEIGGMKCTMDKEFNPTPLWNLVSEWKDVFEREVLTKLNGTEQKLFSQTCRASREAVRRAKIELEDKFLIEDLSSISQLELAWANYQWGGTAKDDDEEEFTKNQEQFCGRVAETNDLALLRWVREEKECAWDWRTSGIAAYLGNLEMLKYCVENGCLVHADHCMIAAKFGNLECLKYLHEKNCAWDYGTSGVAADLGNLEMLKYCVENGCEVGPGTCANAANQGHLECLKYLREKNVKWDHQTVQLARENNHVECLNYALANKCPQTEEEFQALEAEAEEAEEAEEEGG